VVYLFFIPMPVIKINNNYSVLLGSIPDDMFHYVDNECSYYTMGFAFTEQYNRLVYTCRSCGYEKFELNSDLLMCPQCRSSDLIEKRAWDGKVHMLKRKGKCIYFPTGLFSIVREALKHYKIDYKLFDERKTYASTGAYKIQKEGFNLYEYQKYAVERAAQCQRGVIQMGTGAGKTACAAAIICHIGITPVVFYVLSKDLLLQTKEEFEDLISLNGEKINVGIIGGGMCDIQKINVMTIQTAVQALGKKFTKTELDEYNPDTTDIKEHKKGIVNLIKQAKLIFADECHHVPAKIVKDVIFSSAMAKYRFGLSASPWRDSGDDLSIEAQFGRKIVKVLSSQLIREGFLVKPTIHFKKIKPTRKSFRRYDQIYKHAVVQNEERNQYIADVALERAAENKSVLILVKQITHGKEILKRIPGAVLITGKDSLKKRKEVIEKMKSKEQLIAIATTLADEGLNIKCLEVGILAGSGKSSVRALQRVGRFMRLFEGKTEAHIYDFYDDCKYLEEHSKRRRKIYETEEEFEIIDHD